jgi:F-type H+-transporting ATPase subunit b
MELTSIFAEPASNSGIGALGINGGAFISQLISFIIVLLILWRWALPILLRTLENRRAVIQEGVENAERAKVALAEASSKADQIILDAKIEAQETVARATKNAEQVGRQIEDEARTRAEQISQQQIARVQQEANRARLELSREVVNLSIDAASKVINRSVDSQDNRRLVEEFVTTADSARKN